MMSFSAKPSISSGLRMSNLPRNQNLERTQMADELMAWKTGRLPDYNYWHLNLQEEVSSAPDAVVEDT